MLFTFTVFCFLFADFNSVWSRKIVLNKEFRYSTSTTPAPPSQHEKKDNSLKSNADQNVMNQLHRMYRTEVEHKDTDLHHLLILKQQYIARNHIEEVEIDLALDFVPDWSKVDQWSSTARQGIEIRRQKWRYIFDTHSDLPLVQNLTAELAKSGINQSTFCREIAEAYFILSHNSYVYSKGPAVNETASRASQIVLHPAMDKSLKIFMHSLPDSDFKFNDAEELIKIPRSLYHKLLRKDAQMALLKKHHHQSETASGKRHHRRHRHSDTEPETQHPETTPTVPAQNTTQTSSTTEKRHESSTDSSDKSSSSSSGSSSDASTDWSGNDSDDSDDSSSDTETDSSWEWTDSE